MNPEQTRGRILHREKPDGITVEFALNSIDELLTESEKKIPFDSPDIPEHIGYLKSAIEQGFLNAATLFIDSVPSGIVTYAVTGANRNELLLCTAYIRDQRFHYIPLLKTFAVKLAEENQCKTIRFHTVRKGLIKEALAHGFHVSEIVLRINL